MSGIYMKIEGIKGSVTSKGYEGWISLLSFNNAIKRNIEMQVGHFSNRESTIPDFTEFEITKAIDASSQHLFQRACEGQVIPKIEIHVCVLEDHEVPCAKYELGNILIGQYCDSALGVSQPVETIKLNYTKIQKSYIQYDGKSKSQSPSTYGYNLEEASSL